MTEHDESDGPDFKKVMFICGAQTDNDGDFLPKSFTIFSKLVPPDQAMAVVMEKIVGDIVGLNMMVAHGQVAFTPITSWEEFAGIEEIDDSTKMKALSAAIVTEFMGTLAEVSNDKIEDLVSLPWLPDTD